MKIEKGVKMKITRTETDMRFRFKIFGKYQDLIAFYNLVWRNEMFSGNTAGLSNLPNEDGHYWVSLSIAKWDVNKAQKIIEDCTGITFDQFEILY